METTLQPEQNGKRAFLCLSYATSKAQCHYPIYCSSQGRTTGTL